MEPKKERVVEEEEVFVSDHGVEVGIVGGVQDIRDIGVVIVLMVGYE